MKLSPKERLEDIEGNLPGHSPNDCDACWLIARVRQLEKTMEHIAEIIFPMSPEIASVKSALETDPLE